MGVRFAPCRWLVAAALAAAIAASPSQAAAQGWSAPLTIATDLSPSDPLVSVGATGEALLIWRQTRPQPLFMDIHELVHRSVTADGRLGPVARLGVIANGTPYASVGHPYPLQPRRLIVRGADGRLGRLKGLRVTARHAMTPDGGAVVAWPTRRNSIVVQRMSPSGSRSEPTLLEGPRPATANFDRARATAVGVGPSGDAVAMWGLDAAPSDPINRFDRLRAAHIAVDGTVRRRIMTPPGRDIFTMQATVGPRGDATLAWLDVRDTGASASAGMTGVVQARRFRRDGTLSPIVTLGRAATAGGGPGGIAVAAYADGTTLVAWHDAPALRARTITTAGAAGPRMVVTAEPAAIRCRRQGPRAPRRT